MANNTNGQPKQYYGVTISSTFTDLEEHRRVLIRALKAQGLTDVAMENDSAKLTDVLQSSLQMVADGAGYIGVISKKYGEIPKSPAENPNDLSLTELEFNHARELKRPILLFIMGEDHLLHARDVEVDSVKIGKLNAFRESAKLVSNNSGLKRVFCEFDSVDQFKEKVGPAVAELKAYLEKSQQKAPEKEKPASRPSPTSLIPEPPTMYAVPPYIGSHKFVGRQAEMDTIDDWARPADSDSILLFEAIGGNGKSMLSWEWVTNRAEVVRKDWAGILWYSFYEKGATMADFCRHAIAYITRRSIDDFKKKKTPELRANLLLLLNAQPWLIILDGLERVLVAYNRIDAAEAADEDMDNPDDKIANRDPCACIDTEDDELLRLLAAARPSKILISSRLPPKALINSSNQHIQGVKPEKLKGLRPRDAEALLKSCGVTGDSAAIQEYLIANCGNHPLTIGVLAGLINNYFPDRGNFDTWVTASDGGGQLNFAILDLVQRRNHILATAMSALHEKEKQLLGILALVSEAVDAKTLLALNPHLPPEPEKVEEPKKPQDDSYWEYETDKEKERLEFNYKREEKEWQRYLTVLEERKQSNEFKEAAKRLQLTVKALEQRGLLQYDHNSKRYDLHPVVRHVASGGLGSAERQQYGQKIVDFFTAQAHDPYDKAENLVDVVAGIALVRTLLKIGRYEAAYSAYWQELSYALMYNLEAFQFILALIRPFFRNGWESLPPTLDTLRGLLLANDAALALEFIGEHEVADILFATCISQYLQDDNATALAIVLQNIPTFERGANSLATEIRIRKLALELVEITGEKQHLFRARVTVFTVLSQLGWLEDADSLWKLLDKMGRDWRRTDYISGDAEAWFVWHEFRKGTLEEKKVLNAEHLAKSGRNRGAIRKLIQLRGLWAVDNVNWNAAIMYFSEGVRLAREISRIDTTSEIWLVYARLQKGTITIEQADVFAQEFVQRGQVAGRPLAELWHAIGKREEAKKYALAFYKWAWADGEPYVYRYELNKAIELLQRLGVEPPVLPRYDEKKQEKYPWEADVEQLIERLKKEKAEKKKKR